MNKEYIKPDIQILEIETENGFLTGSKSETQQVLIQKDFKIYTDSYEDKSFDWDHTSFE